MVEESKQDHEPDAQTAVCPSHPTPLLEPDPAPTHAVHMGPNLDCLLRLRPQDLLKPEKTKQKRQSTGNSRQIKSGAWKTALAQATSPQPPSIGTLSLPYTKRFKGRD